MKSHHAQPSIASIGKILVVSEELVYQIPVVSQISAARAGAAGEVTAQYHNDVAVLAKPCPRFLSGGVACGHVLIVALVFRAMPHITLVSGYLLPFFQLNVWGYLPTAIIVLVAINQPFTLWMLHSFFLSIPKDLDESALVDGCSRFQAFRLAVIPVMWPGVITTGLFSFLLAYNDFAVTSMLLSEGNQTMVPRIASFMGSIEQTGKIMYAVSAVVSATVPLFILVMFFQRQIVSGLTAGAVKG